MAESPATDRITIRHKSSGALSDIARAALPFWADEWEQVDSQGRRVPDRKTAASNSEQKED